VVNDEVLQADKIYINVGGRASIPDISPADDDEMFGHEVDAYHR